MANPLHRALDDAEFEESVEEALESLPRDLREFMSNVATLVGMASAEALRGAEDRAC